MPGSNTLMDILKMCLFVVIIAAVVGITVYVVLGVAVPPLPTGPQREPARHVTGLARAQGGVECHCLHESYFWTLFLISLHLAPRLLGWRLPHDADIPLRHGQLHGVFRLPVGWNHLVRNRQPAGGAGATQAAPPTGTPGSHVSGC